ncbi:MAG: hypothetical protein H6737_22710 [Alphaproteobacteria bacterium]|nr:hypothetical protein [Alphaproteobacteria bacterium]
MRLLPLFALLHGCGPVLKVVYGFRDPNDARSNAELVEYLGHKGLRTDNVLRVHDDDLPAVFEQIGKSVPEVLVFDREGRRVPYGEPGSCNAPAFAFIENLDRTVAYETTEGRIEDVLAPLHDLDGRPVETDGTADFHVLLYWARWAGRLNVDHVKVWEDQALANARADIRVLKISLDLSDDG